MPISSPLTVRLREGDVSPAVRAQYVRHVKNAQRAIGRLEEKTIREVRKTLRAARSSILAGIIDATPFGQWRMADVLRVVEDKIADLNRKLTDEVLSAGREAADLGYKRPFAAARQLGIDLPHVPVGVPSETLELAQQLIPELIQAETQAVLRTIGGQIRMAFAGGMNREQLTRSVQDQLTKVLRFGTKRARADTIVRTEVNRIHNAAHQEAGKALQASNVKVRKQWVSALGRTTRPAHRELHGTVVDVDAKFPYPGLPKARWPMYPLDPILPAKDSINCNCTTIDVFEILDEETAGQVADEVAA